MTLEYSAVRDLKDPKTVKRKGLLIAQELAGRDQIAITENLIR